MIYFVHLEFLFFCGKFCGEWMKEVRRTAWRGRREVDRDDARRCRRADAWTARRRQAPSAAGPGTPALDAYERRLLNRLLPPHQTRPRAWSRSMATSSTAAYGGRCLVPADRSSPIRCLSCVAALAPSGLSGFERAWWVRRSCSCVPVPCSCSLTLSACYLSAVPRSVRAPFHFANAHCRDHGVRSTQSSHLCFPGWSLEGKPVRRHRWPLGTLNTEGSYICPAPGFCKSVYIVQSSPIRQSRQIRVE